MILGSPQGGALLNLDLNLRFVLAQAELAGAEDEQPGDEIRELRLEVVRREADHQADADDADAEALEDST